MNLINDTRSGCILGTLIVPNVAENVSYKLAFSLLVTACALSIPLFLYGTPEYVVVPPSVASAGFFSYFSSSSHEWSILRSILQLLLPLPIYFAFFYCIPIMWGVTAAGMDHQVGVLDLRVTVEQIMLLHPLLILALIPFFQVVVYPLLRRCGYLPPVTRAILGMNLVIFSLILGGFLQQKIETRGHDLTLKGHAAISFWWLLPQYLLMCSGEVMTIITCLELAYLKAPSRLKSFVMALFFLCMAVGNELVAVIRMIKISPVSTENFVVAGLMFLFMIFFTSLNRSQDPVDPNISDEAVESFDPNTDDIIFTDDADNL